MKEEGVAHAQVSNVLSTQKKKRERKKNGRLPRHDRRRVMRDWRCTDLICSFFSWLAQTWNPKSIGIWERLGRQSTKQDAPRMTTNHASACTHTYELRRRRYFLAYFRLLSPRRISLLAYLYILRHQLKLILVLGGGWPGQSNNSGRNKQIAPH